VVGGIWLRIAMNNKTLKLIALEVLKGRPEAALVLPPESMIRVHVLVSRYIKGAPKFSKLRMKNLHKYFLALPRFQCAKMWAIFSKNAHKKATKWYKYGWDDVQPHYEVICNSLFCRIQFKNGKHYRSDSPLVVKARIDSLNEVLNLKG
jgi:hypothetical protein